MLWPLSFTMNRIVFILFVFLISGCNSPETKELLEYKGPVSEVEDVELYYSVNDKVKVKMLADVLFNFENGDREFPEGVFMEFYDEFGKLESTLSANHAFFFNKENQWRGRGNVEVKNVEKSEQLNTEELFWKPKDKKIFTDKFVTIRQQGDVIYGEGLQANQDLTDYIITKPAGEFEVKE
jgi:LPS export ABC transporter protein LptC